MAFRGQRVMLSRTLVPPENFDMLHGVLKENGAEICLCSNPSYNGRNDFHVLSSCESEKFAELQAQGCNVVGLECILRCAKERRSFPLQKFTCCLSFEGIKILATGFNPKHRAYMQQLVTAMCGELVTNISMDIDFVLANNVLASKYKWSAFTLRKPILSIHWLVHCFREHRRVPHEPYKLPIFAGITICTTGVLLDQRIKIAELVVENGGSLKPDLTRDCTHLIAISPDSDKFKVAKKQWCHIKLVNEQWFWDSLSEKVCLEESSYSFQEASTMDLVQNGSAGSFPQVSSGISGPLPTYDQFSEDEEFTGSIPVTDFECKGDVAPSLVHQVDAQESLSPELTSSGRGCQMYLSSCRVYLTGFESVEMRKLVNIVLGGGGTRHMEFNDKITHVVLGKPSESELKAIRQYAMGSAVHVVMPTWLEECSRQRSEVIVNSQFLVPKTQLLQDFQLKPGRKKPVAVYEENPTLEKVVGRRVLEKQPLLVSKAQLDPKACCSPSQENDALREPLKLLVSNRTSCSRPGALRDPKKQIMPTLFSPIEKEHPSPQLHSTLSKSNNAQEPMSRLISDPAGDIREGSSEDFRKRLPDSSLQPKAEELMMPPITCNGGPQELSHMPNATTRSSVLKLGVDKVFKGRVFGFTPSFPSSMRADVVQCVLDGGGTMLGDVKNGELDVAEFLIVPLRRTADPCTQSNVKRVTVEWIRFCLQEQDLVDINSNIIFQPLSCEVPLSGFESFRISVSQYSDSERMLIYRLCRVLGAKFQDKKMSRKATHLVCKVGGGEKYEAALKWDIEVVTAEWLYACVAQNMVVLPDPYQPNRLTEADKEAGLAITQYRAQPTFCGLGGSFTETLSTQHPTQPSVSAWKHNVEGVDVQGKQSNSRSNQNLQGRSCSVAIDMQVLHCSRASTNCSLFSQVAGGNHDSWDELKASRASEDVIGQAATIPQQNVENCVVGVSPGVPVNLEPSKIQVELFADLTHGSPGNDGRQASKICRQDLVSGQLKNSVDPRGYEEEESGTDVASAIEGLLAQTRKVVVQSGESSRNPDQDLLSPELTKLNRRNHEDVHAHMNFKRPKIMSNRSVKSGGQQLIDSTIPADLKFEESQMESQVVAYGEDCPEKQKIMERVRTRSMSTTGTSGSGGNSQQKQKTSWKGIGFGRLLKAADANK